MESGAGFALLATMVKTFEDQGIRTVFEGIEEGWQLELAEKSRASMVQGYVLARPELAPTSFRVFGRNVQPQGAAPEGGHAPAYVSVTQRNVRPVKAFGRRIAQ